MENFKNKADFVMDWKDAQKRNIGSPDISMDTLDEFKNKGDFALNLKAENENSETNAIHIPMDIIKEFRNKADFVLDSIEL